MRLRNVRGAREAMIDSKYTVNEPEQYKGRWNEFSAIIIRSDWKSEPERVSFL